MQVGASYYPELLDPDVWRADLATARSVGLTILRCGEFAWSRFCPNEGEWDNQWALAFLDEAQREGFKVVWCTPSASLPPRLFDRWPDLNAVTCQNDIVPIGVRRNYCPSHLPFREYCAETAGRLGHSLGSHPAVIGWQIDNEIAGDGFTCWCLRCQGTFQDWLEKRYGTLDELNRAWRTGVWSQCYTAWSQVQIPHRTFGFSQAPALKLAWRRFRSDNWLAFYQAQQQALRGSGIRKPVTTNFYDLTWDMPFDHWAWRPHLDVMGQSLYLEDECSARFELSLLRGLDNRKVWVLEQKAGQQNAQNLYPESLGRIESHLRMCAEGGAEFGAYWHLRQHLSGCEMEHGAVLRHDGKPTRVANAISAAIPGVSGLAAKIPADNRVLVFDFEQRWAQENRPQPGATWDYRDVLMTEWFGAAIDLWDGIRVGSFEEALKKASLVLAPHFQMLQPEQFAMVQAFLERGGVFVTTADFGRLDWENNVLPLPPLGCIAPIAPVPEGEMLHLKSDFRVEGGFDGTSIKGRNFWFVPTASSDTHIADAEFAGPAFLEFRVGTGRLYILTCAFDRESLSGLLGHLSA